MFKEIVIRYSGNFNQPAVHVNEEGDSLQISVRDPATGEEKVLLIGENFSREEFEKRGGKQEEERLLRGVQKM